MSLNTNGKEGRSGGLCHIHYRIGQMDFEETLEVSAFVLDPEKLIASPSALDLKEIRVDEPFEHVIEVECTDIGRTLAPDVVETPEWIQVSVRPLSNDRAELKLFGQVPYQGRIQDAIGIRIAGGSQRSIRIPILGFASGIVDLNPRSIVQVIDQEEVEFQVTLTHQATSRLDIRSVQLTNQAKDLDSDTETTRLNDGKVLLKIRPHLMKQKIIRGKVWVNMEIDDVRERSSIPFVLVRS